MALRVVVCRMGGISLSLIFRMTLCTLCRQQMCLNWYKAKIGRYDTAYNLELVCNTFLTIYVTPKDTPLTNILAQGEISLTVRE